jgi:hypothetical protein
MQRMLDCHGTTLREIGAALMRPCRSPSISRLMLLFLLGAVHVGAAAATDPALGPQVYLFNDRMPLAEIQATVDRISATQLTAQFGQERYALLFEPGTYGTRAEPLVIPVGYYTAVAGLGAGPADVTINGLIQVRNRCSNDGCIALDNFWRSLSNLTLNVTPAGSGCDAGEFWAVSQAAPLRRLRVVGGKFSLMDYCSQPGYASGGFIADSAFEQTVINGSQQQFVIRNSVVDSWSNGVWNQVFAGVQGSPQCASTDKSCAYTTLATAPVTREAPFLVFDHQGRHGVFVPRVQRDTRGPSWLGHPTPGKYIALTEFYVAYPKDSAARINEALRAGKHLLLTPGIYHLDGTLEISRPGTVVIGLGFATVIPQQGTPAMAVTASRGVVISGLLFEAGPRLSPVLLRVGDHGARQPVVAEEDPTTLHDVFFRIGGGQVGKATISLEIESDDVILDHVWAWRADHGQGVSWDDNVAATGVAVHGRGVTAYGLFVEHYQKEEVLWDGEDGRVIFFQNEMPYDPPEQNAWRTSPTVEGYPALKVAGTVRRFHGAGMGSYSFFNKGVPIFATSAFDVPAGLAPGSLQNTFTIFLSKTASGGIRHVVNQAGGASTAANPDTAVRVGTFP